MKPDGGPAFGHICPAAFTEGPDDLYYQGMSLRDYFAGQALQGWISVNAISEIIARQQTSPNGAQQVLAASCYAMADAMLAERSKP